jgi:hypothetical protein
MQSVAWGSLAPEEMDHPSVRPLLNRDPTGVSELSQGILDRPVATVQVGGQAGVGRIAGGFVASVLEEGGGQEYGLVLAPEAGVLAEVVRQGGEREGMGLGSPSGEACCRGSVGRNEIRLALASLGRSARMASAHRTLFP